MENSKIDLLHSDETNEKSKEQTIPTKNGKEENSKKNSEKEEKELVSNLKKTQEQKNIEKEEEEKEEQPLGKYENTPEREDELREEAIKDGIHGITAPIKLTKQDLD